MTPLSDDSSEESETGDKNAKEFVAKTVGFEMKVGWKERQKTEEVGDVFPP